MSEAAEWRELHRCDDLLQARAIATSIAAMEFDVRLMSADDDAEVDVAVEGGCGSGCGCASRAAELPGPFIIQVPREHLNRLRDVLPDIIVEQQEFDESLEARHATSNQHRVMIALIIIVATGLFVLWRSIKG